MNASGVNNWPEIEARCRRAKQALLDVQQQKFEAVCEFLAARADVRTLLEAAFPEPEPQPAQAAARPNAPGA